MRTMLPTIPRARTQLETATHLDAKALAADLRRAVRGEVRFDRGDRALWATDASNYRQIPIGVVLPRDVNDVVRTVELARRHHAPILARGGGTALAGQTCNTAVVLDFSKYMTRVLEVDGQRRRARVEAGTILDDLREAAEAHDLTFGPDPATHSRCTLGGMIGNNSCGSHSVMAEFYGPGARTDQNVEELEILTYDGLRMRVGRTSEVELERIIREGGRKGEIYRRLRELQLHYADQIRTGIPDLARCISGYNLRALLPEEGFNVARALVGSEGTCVTVLDATVTLIPSPAARTLVVLGYPSVYDAGDHIPEIREFKPIAIEGLDDILVYYMKKKGLHSRDISLLPEGAGWLLVEFGGATREEANANAHRAMEAMKREGNAPAMALYDDPATQSKFWRVRESGLGATAFVPGEPDTWPGWEDSAVPVERIGDYLHDLRKLLEKYEYNCALYGHFGQGCVHTRIDFDLTSAAGIEKFRAFTQEGAELVTQEYGGTLSGEHGDGQARGDLLPIMFDDEILQAFREFKDIWDPERMMNPGKLIDAYSRTSNLRLGSDYRPATPETHFRFPNDEGSFGHAALRCVGVGKCRRLDGGTMCPSYMVLREEKHTTRGRAHLLWEMLQGEVITDGWESEEVKESLDLCLACKGCKGECPVNVDVATYKAEFLSHYYERRRRPRHAYAFGMVDRWARAASLAPGLVNLFTQTPGLAGAAKVAAGMTPERSIPRFAPRTFKSWWRARERAKLRSGIAPNAASRRVILWPDTFNNHFYPATLSAAVEVLEDAGCHIVVPEPFLCCGRPLYDYGMLDAAKRRLRTILDALRPEIEAGTPLVGLEPSCVSVFRDELVELMPENPDAKRLAAQTHTFGEWLMRLRDEYELPQLRRRALVHGHCHHKSVLEFDGEERVLERLGLEFRTLSSGCCGLAGSFGFEREKYDLSMAAGERVLLPAVREADDQTLIVADGCSCREQIAHGTERHALHLAEVIQMALHQGEAGASARPEDGRRTLAPRELAEPTSLLPALAGIGAGLLLGGAAVWQLARS